MKPALSQTLPADRIEGRGKRGPQSQWTGAGKYQRHPDGRVRYTSNRNLVTTPAIVAALVPQPTARFFRLACCGAPVRADHAEVAQEHWNQCVGRIQMTRAGVGKTRRIDWDAGPYTRVLTRPRVGSDALDAPNVLAHNGLTGEKRRLAIVPMRRYLTGDEQAATTPTDTDWCRSSAFRIRGEHSIGEEAPYWRPTVADLAVMERQLRSQETARLVREEFDEYERSKRIDPDDPES